MKPRRGKKGMKGTLSVDMFEVFKMLKGGG